MIEVYLKSAYGLEGIKDETVSLSIDHHPFVQGDAEYVETGRKIFSDMFRVSKPGAFLAIVQHDLKKLYQTPRHLLLYREALAQRFEPYDEKIWYRQSSLNLFRKTFAYISILRKPGPKKKTKRYAEYIKDVWFIPDSMRRDGYKDAFHQDVPARLIEALTDPGDIVLDPFLGVGTTLEVAEAAGREGIGFEIDAALRRFYPKHWKIYD